MAAKRPGTPRLLRELNDRAALDLLVAQGPLTRAQIGERTGLSKVTASQLLSRLEDRGLVEVVGSQAGDAGRTPRCTPSSRPAPTSRAWRSGRTASPPGSPTSPAPSPPRSPWTRTAPTTR